MSTNDPQYGTESPQSARSRKTPFVLIGVALVAVFGIFLALSIGTGVLNASERPSAVPDPHVPGPEQTARPDAIGYHGQATNTGELSSSWASGIATAWTLPASDALLPARLIAEGSTLYALSYGSGADAVVTVSAYAVSGAEPVAQRSTAGPLPPRPRA